MRGVDKGASDIHYGNNVAIGPRARGRSDRHAPRRARDGEGRCAQVTSRDRHDWLAVPTKPIRKRGRAGMRLLAGGLAGVAVFAGTLVAGGAWPVAASAGWCALAVVVLVLIWATIWRMDAHATAQHARTEDFSRPTADVILLSASVASLVAVAFTLVRAGREHGTVKSRLIALAVLTVALAWSTVHTVYMLRYGDLYYGDPIGGIDFNQDERPDYRDFAYMALTLGMTFQVSDTSIQTKAIRRAVIRHALVSFLFGTVIVAITINVVAGLLSR